MKIVENNDFNELMDNFKKLSIIEKKELTINEIKGLITVITAINVKNNGDSQMLFNREITDIEDKNHNEEDFVETIYAYVFSIKELIADMILSQENH